MYGWRARVGLIIPSMNAAIEPEFNRITPRGISVHATRVMLQEGTTAALLKMADDIEKAAELLASARVNFMVYACTTGSLVKGMGWDKELIRRIEDKTAIPATTTATAVIEAFRELGVKRAAVATIYNDELNKLEKRFFEAHGVEVLAIEGLGCSLVEELDRRPESAAYTLAKKVNHTDADCIFLSCTGFPTIEVLDTLEKDTGKPVMSSNTATMWAVLKALNIREPIEGYGEILRRL